MTFSSIEINSTMIYIIIGGVIFVLSIVLLTIFANKRKKHLNVSKEMTGGVQQNVISSRQENLKTELPPVEVAAETNFSNQMPDVNNNPVNGTTVPEKESSLLDKDIKPADSTRPLLTQIQNVKPDEGEIVIGYGQDSQTTPQPSPKATPETKSSSPVAPTQSSPETDSTESEITFDS